MRILTALRAAVAGGILIACNGILGVGSDYHRALSKDAGLNGCRSLADCGASGEICLFGACLHTCRKDEDCPAGWRCLGTEQGAACVSPQQAGCSGGDCPGGTTCINAQCRSECVADTACAGDQTCSFANVCVGTDTTHDPGILDAGLPGADAAPASGGVGNGGASSGGASSGGAKGTGATSSSGGTRGTPDAGTDGGKVDDSAVGNFGETCSPNGALACQGHGQQQQLVCNRTWQANGLCTGTDDCDTTPGATAGTCQPTVTACAGAAPGGIVCQGMSRIQCGPDLVTSTSVDTCAAGTQSCLNGVCVACAAGAANCDSNGADCETDLNAVGTCGTTCDAKIACSSTNGTASCTNGVCGIKCKAGYGDCGGANDGCETNLNLAATCGTTCANEVACTVPTPMCNAGTCVPRSCVGLPLKCGASSNESCCTSLPVTGGTFYRSYDGVTSGYTSQSYPATVSNFRLEKFEVTVGRFRKFVAAWNGGWRPATGAGKHTHLHNGSGLADSSGTTTYEQGWDPSWVANVAPIDANLQCDSLWQTWTPSPGANENLPMNCVDWYEAYAFCIWDDGFLPSEAEWNYAASGGSQQRVYPWSSPASSTNIDCSDATYYGAASGTDFCAFPGKGGVARGGSESPKGDGRYGQADLAGNLSEYNLDSLEATSNYPSTTCNDCAYLSTDAYSVFRRMRGGSFDEDASYLHSSNRDYERAAERTTADGGVIGLRCARIP